MHRSRPGTATRLHPPLPTRARARRRVCGGLGEVEAGVVEHRRRPPPACPPPKKKNVKRPSLARNGGQLLIGRVRQARADSVERRVSGLRESSRATSLGPCRAAAKGRRAPLTGPRDRYKASTSLSSDTRRARPSLVTRRSPTGKASDAGPLTVGSGARPSPPAA